MTSKKTREIVDSKSEIAVGRFFGMNEMKSWVSCP